MLSKVVYISLGDLVSLEDISWYPNSSSDIVMSTIMTTHGLVIEDSTADKLTIFNQLMRIIYSRFFEYDIYKKVIGIYEDENSVSPDSDERKYIWSRFVNMFNLTAPRYLVLLEQFTDNAQNPIAQISSTSSGTTRFNDTPQDGGDFDDDEHTTNITQTSATTSTDTGSIMERLDALYKNWRSVFRDWSNEFRCLFYIGGK